MSHTDIYKIIYIICVRFLLILDLLKASGPAPPTSADVDTRLTDFEIFTKSKGVNMTWDDLDDVWEDVCWQHVGACLCNLKFG